MNDDGARTWFFADGYLPEKQPGAAMEAHEALMLLNTGSQSAQVKLDFYFSDREPTLDIAVTVPAPRVVALRLDRPADIGGLAIPPLTQYAIRVRSDRKIVCQFGRLDTTQPNLAYYGSNGYWSD
jgi:hypothetical protein